MARSANIGEMRTRILVSRVDYGVDSEGFQTITHTPVFDGKAVWCKWTYAHGDEVYENMRLGMNQVATITMFFTEEITPQCVLWRNGENGDDKAWKVISINHVEDSRRFTEIRVTRGERA